jgi:hypothetical protein
MGHTLEHDRSLNLELFRLALNQNNDPKPYVSC